MAAAVAAGEAEHSGCSYHEREAAELHVALLAAAAGRSDWVASRRRDGTQWSVAQLLLAACLLVASSTRMW